MARLFFANATAKRLTSDFAANPHGREKSRSVLAGALAATKALSNCHCLEISGVEEFNGLMMVVDDE